MSHFQVSKIGSTTVVQLTTPSLMDPEQLDLMAQSLYRLVDEQERRNFVLDFEHVQYLTSQAIGILLAMQKKLLAKNSRLALCGVGPRLMELLRITRLDRVLSVKPTQEEAVKSVEEQ